jgi:hypothetical protein
VTVTDLAVAVVVGTVVLGPAPHIDPLLIQGGTGVVSVTIEL